MIRVDLSQGDDRWLQWRMGGIGGSDAPIIAGVSPYTTRQELLEQKARNRFGKVRKTNRGKTSAMLRGTLKEPWVRQEYMDLTGQFVEVACGIHDTLDWMRASFDGLSLDGSLVLEVKCPNWRDHSCCLDGQVPTHYFPQCQHLLAVSGAKQLHYVSWSDNKMFPDSGEPGKGNLTPPVKVKPIPGYQQWLIEEETKFWKELMELRKKLSE